MNTRTCTLYFFRLYLLKEAPDVSADKFLLLRPSTPRKRTLSRTLPRDFRFEDLRRNTSCIEVWSTDQRALLERKRGIRNDQTEIVIDGISETLADRARADRVVEAEQRRFGRRGNQAASFAGKLLAESASAADSATPAVSKNTSPASR